MRRERTESRAVRGLARTAALGAAFIFASLTGSAASQTAEPDPKGAVDPIGRRPLSGVIALTVRPGVSGDIPTLVKGFARAFAKGQPPPRTQFPLLPAVTDTVRTLDGLRAEPIVRWLDPLHLANADDVPRFGANNDYIAFFGDGWNRDWKDGIVGRSPYFAGSSQSGWLWVNHEYVSNLMPLGTPTGRQSAAPTGQHLTLALHLAARGVFDFDVRRSGAWTTEAVDTYIGHYKRQLGGSWFRVVRNPSTGAWAIDQLASPIRYDSTSRTLARLTGQRLFSGSDHDDAGKPLATGVVAGIMGDCSGGQTPWGTILTAEENVQTYYGDLEACWDLNNTFVPGTGFDAGEAIAPPLSSPPEARVGDFGRSSRPEARHHRDTVGFLTEIDPGLAPAHWYDRGGKKRGHRKLGLIGRARWENATIVVDREWQLPPDRPIVIYAGDDRQSGRVYKFVSGDVYRRGMKRGEVRALLDRGTLYVAHFADLDNATGYLLRNEAGAPPATKRVAPSAARPGRGRWIRLSVDSTDVVPNATAFARPGTKPGGEPAIDKRGDKKTVGQALVDPNWNGIGAFPTDDHVRLALFTACNKIGVMELNRPEDVEWNPRDPSGTPRLYIAFTNHTRRTALDASGRVASIPAHRRLGAVQAQRVDRAGSIFALEEDDPADPGRARTFTFIRVWAGTANRNARNSVRNGGDVFSAACPDNLFLDREGGVWFVTDGNFWVNRHADAVYYLDPETARAFRVAAVPGDAEATGPCFTPDMRTLFLSVQHPGENLNLRSTWPHRR